MGAHWLLFEDKKYLKKYVSTGIALQFPQSFGDLTFSPSNIKCLGLYHQLVHGTQNICRYFAFSLGSVAVCSKYVRL